LRAIGLAVSVLVAFVAAVLSVATVSLAPPGLKPRQLQIAGATTHVLVDPPRSMIVNPRAIRNDFDSLSTRTHLLGALMASDPVKELIAQRAGLDPDRIASISHITVNVPATLKQPDSEQRANDILLSHEPYRIDVQAKAVTPVIDVYTQAPTTAEAERLADAAAGGMREYLRLLAVRQGTDPSDQVRLEQLGAARGALINGGAGVQIAGLTFLVVFGLASGLLWAASRLRRLRRGIPMTEPATAQPLPRAAGGAPRLRPRWQGGGSALVAAAALPADVILPRPLPAWTTRLRISRERLRALVDHGGDWPRTTRLLPWGIALFLAILWLVPFNQIALTASLPIDLKFDRLVLPFIAGLWVLALAAGGPGAPRVRATWMHLGLAVFVAISCLSVVLDARWLNQTLEFDLGMKKLTLLAAYGAFFLMMSSIVRRSEVRAFIKYTLVLAVICAIGTIWEYRFQYNVFYDGAAKLLPGFFQVGVAESSAVDEIGRRLVRGPAELGLEAVAMLSMALPIALVGIMHAGRWRDRILYGLAACLLMAAAISTYRKSALMAPISIGLTLAYFRRRELLKLAPLGVILLVVVHVLSPGAFGSIALQLNSNRLGVATVSDRAADYDAVRPDLWTNLAFGRGYGTYDHTSYRILDSEILSRVIEVGVLGLIAYMFMIVSVVIAARAVIRARDPTWSPVALACAAAAVAFLVLSFLFDVMAFPHVPYLLLSLAGLLAVVVAPVEGEDAWSS
jgi:hypothetical protein